LIAKKIYDMLPWYVWLVIVLLLAWRIYTLWEYIMDYRKKCKGPKSCMENPLAMLAQIIFILSWPIRTVLYALIFGP